MNGWLVYSGMKQFMNCMDRVVRKHCGKAAADWQWNASLSIMLGNEFDRYCLSNNSKHSSLTSSRAVLELRGVALRGLALLVQALPQTPIIGLRSSLAIRPP